MKGTLSDCADPGRAAILGDCSPAIFEFFSSALCSYSGKVQLTLVWNDVSIKEAKEVQLLIKALKARWVFWRPPHAARQ